MWVPSYLVLTRSSEHVQGNGAGSAKQFLCAAYIAVCGQSSILQRHRIVGVPHFFLNRHRMTLHMSFSVGSV